MCVQTSASVTCDRNPSLKQPLRWDGPHNTYHEPLLARWRPLGRCDFVYCFPYCCSRQHPPAAPCAGCCLNLRGPPQAAVALESPGFLKLPLRWNPLPLLKQPNALEWKPSLFFLCLLNGTVSHRSLKATLANSTRQRC